MIKGYKEISAVYCHDCWIDEMKFWGFDNWEKRLEQLGVEPIFSWTETDEPLFCSVCYKLILEPSKEQKHNLKVGDTITYLGDTFILEWTIEEIDNGYVLLNGWGGRHRRKLSDLLHAIKTDENYIHETAGE